MGERRSWTFRGHPKGAEYRALLEYCCTSAEFAGLITYDSANPPRERTDALSLLNRHLVREDFVRSWPGSEVFGRGKYIRHLYRCSEELVVDLLHLTVKLYEWVNPHRPDDLHFIRADGSTLLGNTAGHGEAWLELDEREYSELELYPTIKALLRNKPDRLSTS